jgi:hypothetical protein
VCKSNYYAPSSVQPCQKCPAGKSNSGATFAVGVFVVIGIILLLFVKCYREIGELESTENSEEMTDIHMEKKKGEEKEDDEVQDKAEGADEYGGTSKAEALDRLAKEILSVSSFKSKFDTFKELKFSYCLFYSSICCNGINFRN